MLNSAPDVAMTNQKYEITVSSDLFLLGQYHGQVIAIDLMKSRESLLEYCLWVGVHLRDTDQSIFCA